MSDLVPREVAAAILRTASEMRALGWVASVSGNISARLGVDRIAMTRSGGRKGFLVPDDVIAVDLRGRPLVTGDVPSAETALHCQLYAAFPEVGAVLHGHSVAATVLSRLSGGSIRLAGYEMLKAFDGITTHETVVELPVLDNDQDMGRLRDRLAGLLRRETIGYVLRGHGSYAWGRDLGDAMAKLESLEFLIACELETRRATGERGSL